MWIRFEALSLWLELTMADLIGRTAWGGSHNFLILELCHEYPTMTTTIEVGPLLRRGYFSATGTRMPLKRCDETLQNCRCVVSRTEVSICTGFPLSPLNVPL